MYQLRPLPDKATIVAFTDITNARSLESALADRSAALADAERLKREFVGNVSYELRTPLTTIIGYSELLERSSENLSERGRGHVAAVRLAATKLARSIDDVLDMAQIDAGEMALDLGDVDVSEVLRDTALRWGRHAEESRVNLQVEAGERVGSVRADGHRLVQIIDHLVENALAHTPPGGQVIISARRTIGEVQLEVTDSGEPIPFRDQAHVFERFGGGRSRASGLSLPLVKALTELHGGWMSLESGDRPTTKFICHLPG